MRRVMYALLISAVLPISLHADLSGYVSKADNSYRWKLIKTSEDNSLQFAQLHMISQTWRGTPWQHRLLVARPTDIKKASHALLIIGGGSWRKGLENAPFDDAGEMQLVTSLAKTTQMPVVLLSHVPFQPLFDGKKEDQIIAYTFDRFLDSGDEEWPLLLPMTKAAVRAMDTVQAFARKEWQLDIPRFIVTGASKRGWTTWLTGASDSRVAAIAPMVIDMLNMEKQSQRQKEIYGQYSERIDDYTRLKIQDRMSTEAGHKLLSIVDPYSYRKRLTMPKLILLGTNDPYWTLDSLNLYYDDLVGEKFILYVPNAGHGLNDEAGRMVKDVSAFALKVDGKLDFPKLHWAVSEKPDSLQLTVQSDQKPVSVSAWHATAQTRDFRKSKWTSTAIQSNDSGYAYQLERPQEGFAAVLAEVLYQIDDHPLYLSTNVHIIGPAGSSSRP